jgi:hypothetical protein
VALIEVVTCYFFPEGVDTSGEHWWSGFWCGVVAPGVRGGGNETTLKCVAEFRGREARLRPNTKKGPMGAIFDHFAISLLISNAKMAIFAPFWAKLTP